MQDVGQSLYYRPLEVNSGQLGSPLASPGFTEEQQVPALQYTHDLCDEISLILIIGSIFAVNVFFRGMCPTSTKISFLCHF